MNHTALLEAMESIDDEYILSAQKRLFCTPHGHRNLRKTLICIAAVIALMLASLTAAMAVNPELRDYFLSIFYYESTETPPIEPDVTVPGGELEPIGSETIGEEIIDGQVHAYYFKGYGGFGTYGNGILYSRPYHEDFGTFYAMTDDGLTPLEATLVDFPYSFQGTDFRIAFQYVVWEGRTLIATYHENMDLDPLKYGWDMHEQVSGDLAILILPYSTGGDCSHHPFLFNIKTLEMTDLLEGIDLGGIVADVWDFSEDFSYAIITGIVPGEGNNAWFCDLREKTIVTMAEKTGLHLNGFDCRFLDGKTILCTPYTESGFDVARYDPEADTVTMLIEGTQSTGPNYDQPGFRDIPWEIYVHGHYGLLTGADGARTLIDLRDGRQMPLKGLPQDKALSIEESPDGNHLLFAFEEKRAGDSLILQLGILDTQTGVLRILNRNPEGIQSEDVRGWVTDTCIAVIAHTEEDELGWYLYLYEF